MLAQRRHFHRSDVAQSRQATGKNSNQCIASANQIAACYVAIV